MLLMQPVLLRRAAYETAVFIWFGAERYDTFPARCVVQYYVPLDVKPHVIFRALYQQYP